MNEERFVLYEHKGNYYILENPREYLDFIEMLGDALTDEEIVGLLNEQLSRIKELEEGNEQLKKRVDKLKVIMAEFGATLLMNGFDIEVDGKDLMEMINNG